MNLDRSIAIGACVIAFAALVVTGVVQRQSDAQMGRVMAELGAIRAALGEAGDTGTLAELRTLVEGLSLSAGNLYDPLAPGAAVAVTGFGSQPAGHASSDPAAPQDALSDATDAVADAPIDPNLPTNDCIPTGIRFIAVPNETYPICQSTAQIRLSSIGPGTVTLAQGPSITEGSFGTLADSNCSVSVFSADVEGYAELRVTC